MYVREVLLLYSSIFYLARPSSQALRKPIVFVGVVVAVKRTVVIRP